MGWSKRITTSGVPALASCTPPVAAAGGDARRAAIKFAILDGAGQHGQAAALIGDIGGLALHGVGDFAEQPVDHHQGLAGFVLQQRQLAMIFIHRARDIEGGADLVQREMGGGGIIGDIGAQRVEGIDVGRQRVQRGLGGVPLRHQFGIALGGADLKPGGDLRLGLLIGAGRGRAAIAQIGQTLGIGGQLCFPGPATWSRRVWMVLLTAVPVSPPGSMVTGVMVATGASRRRRWARRQAGAAVRPRRRRPAADGVGARLSLSPPNRLSIVDIGTGGQAQARGQRKSQKKAPFEPWFALEYPLISALRCRRWP